MHMTDEELVAENKRLEEAGVRKKKQEHVQGTFLQKYYHKGVFYLDEESVQSSDDIRNRDFHAPTEKDMVNKRLLPRVMQVRDFGQAGRRASGRTCATRTPPRRRTGSTRSRRSGGVRGG